MGRERRLGRAGVDVVGVAGGVVDAVQHLLQVEPGVRVATLQRNRDLRQLIAKVNRPEPCFGAPLDPAHDDAVVAFRHVEPGHARAAPQQVDLHEMHPTALALPGLRQVLLPVRASVLVGRAQQFDDRNELVVVTITDLEKRKGFTIHRRYADFGGSVQNRVDKKKPKAKVKNLVPKQVTVPGVPQPLPTDVEEIGVVTIEPNTMRVRPAIPGFSIGHVKITAGTFGCLVRKRDDDKTLYILSNSHVQANEGLGAKGDKILQPGKADGGKMPADILAELAEWVAFQFTAAGYPNLADAAIARVKTAKNVSSVIRLIGVPQGINRTVQRNIQVQKTGRTTDHPSAS
jgi:hypothetical protein